jgi:rfaE bifunctional protein nucleotidyltransferase chain/domain
MTSSTEKILRNAAQLAPRLPQLPRPLVFTNGCFDILHRGHVTYLEQARALGASLVVGVNTDASVQRLGKDPHRPINTLEDRMSVLAALESVSLVIAFDDDTPLELIKQVRPEHLVKGGDWTPDKIVGNEFVRGYNGQVHSIPFQFQRSTTDLIRRIRHD